MLSKRTKYGLKALSYLVTHEDKWPIQARLIAEEESVSTKFLESILLLLKKAGYLGSKRGKFGGYYLLKPAEETPITNIIRILEGPIALLPCVSLNYYEKCSDCPREEECGIHNMLIQVRDKTLEIFEKHRLSDLKKINLDK